MMAFLMGLKSIAPTDLERLLRQKRVTVLDVNSPQSFARAHVPGAVNLDSTAYRGEDLPADKRSSLVFYCSNPMCRKAPIAAKRAKQLGYEDVKVMSAGISGWISSGLPTQGA
jgi:rhodanese-related sulfurtransferase